LPRIEVTSGLSHDNLAHSKRIEQILGIHPNDIIATTFRVRPTSVTVNEPSVDGHRRGRDQHIEEILHL